MYRFQATLDEQKSAWTNKYEFIGPIKNYLYSFITVNSANSVLL